MKEEEEYPIDESSEKQKYINENIIDKGYNPEDLNAFIINRRAGTIEEINLKILKEEIEAFKNSLLEDTYITIKKTMPITKKDEQLSELYSSQTFNINYLKLPECELTKLEKDGKKIKIKISEEKFEKFGGIFSSQIKYICTVSCEELQSSVRRTIDDFEWLKLQLNEKYPLIYIPPLYTKDLNKNEKLHQQTRYINKFFNAILRKKILRISPMLHQFLVLDNNKFKKYKEALVKRKFILQLKMENFKTTKESEEINFIKPQIYLPGKYLKKLNISEYNKLFDELNKLLLEVEISFKNLSSRVRDLSNIFSKIYTHATQAEQHDKYKNACVKFRNVLSHWADSFEKQSSFFGIDCKEFFIYINSEINELNNIYTQYNKFKGDYEKLGIQLYEKKEKLFAGKQYDKWELSKEGLEKLNEFKNNFSEASQYMCKDFSTLVDGQKIRVACSCNIILREFKKADKYFGEQLENIFESFKILSKNVMKEKYDENLYKTL